MSLLDTIKKAFQMLPEIASVIGSLALTVVILATVIGVFAYQVFQGSINVDSTSSALVNTTTQNFSQLVNTIWSAGISVSGFIVLGVIAMIAIGILGKKFLGGGGAKL